MSDKTEEAIFDYDKCTQLGCCHAMCDYCYTEDSEYPSVYCSADAGDFCKAMNQTIEA